MSISSAVKDSVRWMAIGRFGAQIISWIATLWVIRLLEPADYGLLAMAMVFMALADRMRTFGFEAYLVRTKELSDEAVQSVMALGLSVNAIAAILLVLLAPAIGRFYEEPEVALIVQVMSVRYLFQILSLVPEALITREMRFRVKAVVEVIVALVHSGVTLGLALTGHGVWALVLGMMAGEGTRALLYFLYKPRLYRPRVARELLRSIVSFGGYTMGRSFGQLAIAQAPKLILGKWASKEELGLYSVAIHLASLPMTKIMTIVAEVAYSAFSRLQENRLEAERNYLKAMTLIAFVAFPMFWGLASVSPTLVPVVLGEQWVAAIIPIAIISFVTPFRMLFQATTPAVVAMRGPAIPFKIVALIAVSMVAGFVVGVQWGATGVALVWGTLYPVLFLVGQSLYLRALRVPLQRFYGLLLIPILLSLAMAGCVFMLEITVQNRIGDLGTLVLCVLAGALLYVLGSMRFQTDNIVLARGMLAR